MRKKERERESKKLTRVRELKREKGVFGHELGDDGVEGGNGRRGEK